MKKKNYNIFGGNMKLNDLKGLYIAHRGIQTNQTIENTLPAFSLALDKNVPIELDIHILKDGNLVVYHDDNLKRLMNINRNIDSYIYDELKQLTFPNTNTHIPLFKEVLDLVNKKEMIVIEIKRTNIMSYQEYCRKIVSILEKYSGDFVIKSFDVRIVHWFLHHTNYITGLLIANRKNSYYDFLMQRRILIACLKPNFISVNDSIVSSKMVQNFRKKNPVLVWTIRNMETLNKVSSKADSYLIEKFYF